MTKNPEKSKKVRAAISVLLVVALLVGSAFAFLSAFDSKSNVFTIGKVKVELQEYFDANNDDTAELYESGVTPPAFENILPGQIVEKDPFVVNTGDTDAFVYMAVGLPTTPMDNIYYDADQDDPTPLICDTDISIPIKAFAIQDGYENCTDATSIWDAFVASNENGVYDALGETKSTANNVQLFKTIYNASRNGVSEVRWNTEKWTQLGNPVKTVNAEGDTHTYYIFAFNGANNGKLPAGTSTYNSERSDSLFTDVQLVENIGEIKPVAINYYGPSENENVLSASSNDATNIPENYTLLYTEEINSGDIINNLYFDNSLSKLGYAMDWIDVETDESLYVGMTVTKSVDAIVEYKDLVVNREEAPETDPVEYDSSDCLTWNGFDFVNNSANLTADKVTGVSICGINSNDENCPSSPTTIIVPEYITIVKDNDGNYMLTNSYYVSPSQAFLSTQNYYKNLNEALVFNDFSSEGLDIIFEKFKTNETTAQVPVSSINVNGETYYPLYGQNLTKLATNLVVPDTVNKYIGFQGSMSNTSVLQSINIPFNCKYIGNAADFESSISTGAHSLKYNPNLTNITIPETVIGISGLAFANTGIKEITLPKSIKMLHKYAFSGLNTVNISDINQWANIRVPDVDINNFEETTPLLSGVKLLLNGQELSGKITLSNTVTGIAPGAFSGQSKITEIVLPNSVTSIGSHAFSGCYGLTSLTIPNSVTSIGYIAFSNCPCNIVIPASVTSIADGAFYYGNAYAHKKVSVDSNNPNYSSDANGSVYNKNKTELLYGNASDIANTVTKIRDYAFYRTNLTSITIPNSVANIGRYAFFYTSLTSLTIPEGVTSIGDFAFNSCANLTNITISDSVNYIGKKAFVDTRYYNTESNWINNELYINNSLIAVRNVTASSYNIKDGTTVLASNLFERNSTLTAVTLPNSLIGISDSVFNACKKLSNINLPNGLVYIGNSAFAGCYLLSSLNLSNSITSIGESAFNGCSGLTGITIPSNLASINNSTFTGCTGLTSITIPSSVTSIGDFAFDNCSGLTNIVIPDGVTTIGSCAFRCRNVTQITIPSSVSSIGLYAFAECWQLNEINVDANNNYYSSENGVLFNKDKTELIQYPVKKTSNNYTIPNSVTTISPKAFYECDNLMSITISGNVTNIGDSAFYGLNGLFYINFSGTTSQWNSITFGLDCFKLIGTNEVNCSDGNSNPPRI